MDTYQIDLVNKTMEMLEGMETILAQDFYARLFAEHPDTRDLFPADLAAQQAKLVAELAWLAGSLQRVDALVERAGALGRRHVDYGVVADHYAVMPACLIASLGAVLGEQFTPEMAQAWRRALHLITETMQQGARW
jgi:hemoglobin-like flavoprotein